MPIKKLIKKVTGDIQGHLDEKFGLGEGNLHSLTPDTPVKREAVRDYREKKIDGIAKKGKTRGNR